MNEYEELGQPSPTSTPLPIGKFAFTYKNGDVYYGVDKKPLPDDQVEAELLAFIQRNKGKLENNRSMAKSMPDFKNLAEGANDYGIRPDIVNAMKILEAWRAKKTIDSEKSRIRNMSGAR